MNLIIAPRAVELVALPILGIALAAVATRNTRLLWVNHLDRDTGTTSFVRDLLLEKRVRPVVNRVVSCLAVVGKVLQSDARRRVPMYLIGVGMIASKAGNDYN